MRPSKQPEPVWYTSRRSGPTEWTTAGVLELPWRHVFKCRLFRWFRHGLLRRPVRTDIDAEGARRRAMRRAIDKVEWKLEEES
jgi:hypothetical protein